MKQWHALYVFLYSYDQEVSYNKIKVPSNFNYEWKIGGKIGPMSWVFKVPKASSQISCRLSEKSISTNY